MESAKIEIREVIDKKDLKTFISVPWSIYRHDPNWIPPLKFERKEAFSEKHPYFKHARWKAWVAYLQGEPVGRISAQIDELYLERHDAHTGFFGLVEAADDQEIFGALFGTAEAWLKEQGMHTILGPFNLGINQEIGCLVEGFDSPPYVMMGHAKPYYGGSIEGQGYEKAQDVLSYEMIAEKFAMPGFVQRLLQRLSGKISVRQVDRKKTPAELEIMRSICVNLARLRHNFRDGDVGEEPYFKVERAMPVEQLDPLLETFGLLEPAAMYRAALILVRFYQETARHLAQKHGIAYPERLVNMMVTRLETIKPEE